MDRVEEIILVETNPISSSREAIQYITKNFEGVVLGFFIIGFCVLGYLKSPLYDKREKEEELLRENTRKLTSNYISVSESIEANRDAIKDLSSRIERLEDKLVRQSEVSTDEILDDIRELKSMLDVLRTMISNRGRNFF